MGATQPNLTAEKFAENQKGLFQKKKKKQSCEILTQKQQFSKKETNFSIKRNWFSFKLANKFNILVLQNSKTTEHLVGNWSRNDLLKTQFKHKYCSVPYLWARKKHSRISIIWCFYLFKQFVKFCGMIRETFTTWRRSPTKFFLLRDYRKSYFMHTSSSLKLFLWGVMLFEITQNIWLHESEYILSVFWYICCIDFIGDCLYLLCVPPVKEEKCN